ncbi:MAG TPA: hypothetical protein VLE02_01125 [Nitrosarchaeum sp.]|nr:hypothetical protein [Nitrosarchaeum sp.]
MSHQIIQIAYRANDEWYISYIFPTQPHNILLSYDFPTRILNANYLCGGDDTSKEAIAGKHILSNMKPQPFISFYLEDVEIYTSGTCIHLFYIKNTYPDCKVCFCPDIEKLLIKILERDKTNENHFYIKECLAYLKKNTQ